MPRTIKQLIEDQRETLDKIQDESEKIENRAVRRRLLEELRLDAKQLEEQLGLS